MTESEAMDLGRAAVGCPAWLWLPGMRYLDPDGSAGRLGDAVLPAAWRFSRWCVPDLRDPCTAGGLLALVREAWGDVTIHLTPAWRDRYDSGEPYVVWHVERAIEGDTEWLRESGAWGELEDGHRDPPIESVYGVAALVSALRAAPVATR